MSEQIASGYDFVGCYWNFLEPVGSVRGWPVIDTGFMQNLMSGSGRNSLEVVGLGGNVLE